MSKPEKKSKGTWSALRAQLEQLGVDPTILTGLKESELRVFLTDLTQPESAMECTRKCVRPMTDFAGWRRLFDEAHLSEREQRLWFIRECGGRGNCLFEAIAAAYDEVRLPGEPTVTFQNVRDWAAAALRLDDVRLRPAEPGAPEVRSLLAIYRDELRNPERAAQVAFARQLIRLPRLRPRLRALRQVLRTPGTRYQGDLETLRLLLRDGTPIAQERLGFLVFALVRVANPQGNESAFEEFGSIVCEPFLRPDTQTVIMLHSVTGHWQLVSRQQFSVVPIDYHAMPGSLRAMIVASCTRTGYLQSYGASEFRALDCARVNDVLTRADLEAMAAKRNLPVPSTPRLCELVAQRHQQLQEANALLAQAFARRLVSPIQGQVQFTDLVVEAEPLEGKPWFWRNATPRGALQIVADNGEAVSFRNIPKNAGFYVQDRDRVRVGQLIAEWSCRLVDSALVTEAARQLQLPEYISDEQLCRRLQQ